ncbi:MAG: phenylalanine--tRNA ligase subunit alpha [Acidobacteria bacterium]|nr:phenylalanine--tRNA ligase subunit alpha [Acidobacteriota bacterium]
MTQKTAQSLEKLGIAAPDAVAPLFAELREEFDRGASTVSDEATWKTFRDAWLGRKSGVLTQITDNWLKPASPELKRTVGAALNALRAHVESRVTELQKEAEAGAEKSAAAAEHFDLSLPGPARLIGSEHIIRQTIREIEEIFLSLGYTVVEGNEIETPYYNFEALNIPEHHPARDTMDTFYLAAPPAQPGLLLRTHTSPMQVRTMEKQKPPVRVIVPGRVYRRENPDATHAFAFHQVEGLAVDTDITFCEFKGTIDYFVRQFFGPKVRTRLRPSYFQFTEPSAEVDGSCQACDGAGCRVCKGTGWIELFGSGMVNPAVYGYVNYDAKKLNGFAFGVGVERFALLKYGTEDIQMYCQNDIRFLRQF